jgi:hypothetical protein
LTVKSQAAKKQEAGPGLVFVEGGTLPWVKFKMMLCMIGIILNSAACSVFYMDETEVTNFISGIFRLAKKRFPPEEDNYKHI